jgi:hypothetical protein
MQVLKPNDRYIEELDLDEHGNLKASEFFDDDDLDYEGD